LFWPGFGRRCPARRSRAPGLRPVAAKIRSLPRGMICACSHDGETHESSPRGQVRISPPSLGGSTIYRRCDLTPHGAPCSGHARRAAAPDRTECMPLPRVFCWTRFGTEAGETIDKILARKETERVRNNGVFLWGIGNALGPSIRALVLQDASPEVIFSPIKGPAKPHDISPTATVAWTSGIDLCGSVAALPKYSRVVSRAVSGSRGARHYALVCHAESPLVLGRDPERFTVAELRNLVTGNPVGASQVTAVVRHVPGTPGGADYQVALRVRLVAPYFLELRNPTSSRGADDRLQLAMPL
jgi:hypothetical protein